VVVAGRQVRTDPPVEGDPPLPLLAPVNGDSPLPLPGTGDPPAAIEVRGEGSEVLKAVLFVPRLPVPETEVAGPVPTDIEEHFFLLRDTMRGAAPELVLP